MRVLLTSWGSRGDIEPLAGLAVALQALGAEVLACVPPDEEFVQLLAGVGVPVLPLGPSVREVVTGAGTPSARSPFQLAPELVAARFEALGAAARDCDALVATGLLPSGARSVAEKLGIRYVHVSFHPYALPSPHRPPLGRPGPPDPVGETDNRVLWRFDAEKAHALYGEAENRGREALGLTPVTNVRDYVTTDRPWLAADPMLAPWDGELDVVQMGAWILEDKRPLSASLNAFLEAGPPPVYVGFGSMPMRSFVDAGRVVVEAVRAQGRRLVVARGWADLSVIDSQSDCFVIGEVNQQALFGRVAAVVHHGGAGTTTTAARAGVPQVVVPQAADQPYWARRVAGLGIGVAHDGPAPTLESLSAALGAVLSADVKAETVAGLIRTDGATVAAQLLLDGGGLDH